MTAGELEVLLEDERKYTDELIRLLTAVTDGDATAVREAKLVLGIYGARKYHQEQDDTDRARRVRRAYRLMAADDLVGVATNNLTNAYHSMGKVGEQLTEAIAMYKEAAEGE